MSDAVADFLNSGTIPQSAPKAAATPATAAPTGDPVYDWMASGGATRMPVAPREGRPGILATAKNAIKNVNPIGAAENGLNALTGAAGQAVGGIRGLASKVAGASPAEAAHTVEDTAQALTYEPRTQSGKFLGEIMRSPYNPMNYAGEAGKYLGDKTLDATGSPAVATAVETGVNVAGNALGGVAALKLGGRADSTMAGRSMATMDARFKELQRTGRDGAAPTHAATEITPQMLRGQEPIPPELQFGARASAETPSAPQPAGSAGLQAPGAEQPNSAPALTVENASPQIRKVVEEAGNDLSPQAVQRHVEADSLPVPVRLSTGQATGNLEKLSDEMNKRGAQPAYAHLFNEQNGKLIENVNAIRERVAPDVLDTNHVDNGAALIDSYKALNAAREAEVSANYKALADANDGQIPVDGKAFATEVDKALGSGLVNKREFLPPAIERIVQRIGSSEQQMTFDDFTTLRTILAKEARKAGQAGDGNAAHAISLVRDQLENIPMGPGAEALKPLADTAKNSAKALFRDIEADPAWEAAINGKVPPDNFVKKFVISGPRDGVARMKTNIGADPIADQTIAASALNYLKERAGTPNDTGNFSQAGYNKALNALRPKIDSLFDPTAAQQIETLGKVARYTQEQPRGSYFNNSGTFVAHARDAAQAAGEGLLNLKTMGLSGYVKGALTASKEAKAAAESVKLGAGIKLSDLPRAK